MLGYITKPKPGIMINPLHSLFKGLVGYWIFNEGAGSKVNDISGLSNHGTLKGISLNVQGSGWCGSKSGGGLCLDGSNDYIAVNPISIADNTPWSISMRVKLYDSTKARLFGNQLILNKNTRFFYKDSNSEFRLYNDANDAVTWSTPFLTDKLQDIVLVCDGTSTNNINLYINNVNISAKTLADSSLTIEKFGSGGTTATTMDGFIDLIYIYNRALLVSEIKQLHHNPFCNLLKAPLGIMS